MHILADNNIPDPLLLALLPRKATRAREFKWDRIPNGRLLDNAEQDGFDVFLTGDQRITSQQNLTDRKLAIVILRNPNWNVARRYVRKIATAIDAAEPGTIQIVDMPFR